MDSLDPFSEGIVFSVRPPKKSWKNISNLSGGEKTLSSLALVFALHYYKVSSGENPFPPPPHPQRAQWRRNEDVCSQIIFFLHDGKRVAGIEPREHSSYYCPLLADSAVRHGRDWRGSGLQECVHCGQLHQGEDQECSVHHHQPQVRKPLDLTSCSQYPETGLERPDMGILKSFAVICQVFLSVFRIRIQGLLDPDPGYLEKI